MSAGRSAAAAATRRFRPYPAYKDSGVEWLGEIPAGWEVKKWRYSCHITEGQVAPDDDRYRDRVMIAPNHIESGTGRILFTETADGQGAISGKYLVKPGDIIYSKIRPALNKACIATGDWLCSADMYPVKITANSLSSNFLLYFILSEPFVRLMVDESMRVAMPKVNRDKLAACPLLVPPRAEQEVITAFLDRETAKIDALVAKKERLIELLQEKRTALITRAVTKGLDPNVPMKDSGVEWLYQYPAHWTDLPLKRWVAVKITDGPHETPDLVTEGVDFISAEAVSNGRIDFDKRRGFISPELHAYYCRKCKPVRDDILMCKSGATTGKLARVDVDFEFSIWSPLAVVRSHRSRILPRFLEMTLGSEYVQKQIKRTWSAGTQPNISMGDLEQLYVVAPNIEEQAKILADVDEEAGGFDALIAKVREAIERLQELRTALISAAVAGKIDVRQEAA